MNIFTSALFSFSIGIGGALALLQRKAAVAMYQPFIYLLWVGLINEATSLAVVKQGYSNLINYNVFVLLECLLITWLFHRWWGWSTKLPVLFLGPVCIWAIEWSLRPSPGFCSYFIMLYSVGIVFASIHRINHLLLAEPESLAKHPQFIACVAFIIYFTFSALTESFWVFGLQQSQFFRVKVLAVQNWINLLTNLLYAATVLWMPTKPVFILRS